MKPNHHTLAALFTVLITLFVTHSKVRAQFWVFDGSPVCTAAGTQDGVDITREQSSGTGAVMVWHDNRSGANYDIYAQRLGANGQALWPANGVAICSASGAKLYPLVTYEGYGHYAAVWYDSRDNGDVYAGIFDPAGNRSTPLAGLPIATGGSYQREHDLASNTFLGVNYVAWMDDRNGNDDVYVQAFNTSNPGFMAANGQAICTAADYQGNPVVVANGGDGCITAWLDYRNGYWDVYAQNVSLGGGAFWTADGVLVSNGTTEGYEPEIASDGAGGAIIVWVDNRDGAYDLYAQRINSSGNQAWGIGGVAIRALGGGNAIFQRMVTDGMGNVFIAWQDDRGAGYDVYVQRINATTGVPSWTFNGVGACTEAFDQTLCDVAPDGAGGAVVAWQDYRNPSQDLYAQRVGSTGTLMWDFEGKPVCTAGDSQFLPRLAPDGSGGSIVAWTDRRSEPFNGDIRAVRIENANGLWGYPEPVILSVTDVPNDQGGFVNVTWRRGETVLNFFQVWRRPLGSQTWDFVNVQGDDSSPTWTMTVPTTADAVPGNPNLHEFKVEGFTFQYDVMIDIETGSSVDNLAPPAPTLIAQRNGVSVDLLWNSTAPDIQNYDIYRANFSGFPTTAQYLIATSVTTSYTDYGVPGTALYYRVRARDIHANLGPASNEASIIATGIGDTPLPKELTLEPNSPNPFSGSTELRVGLPHASDVHLEVYDVAGHRVLERGLGRIAAGWKSIPFDGRDEAGKQLPGGVYFYRVTAGTETLTRKMVIAR